MNPRGRLIEMLNSERRILDNKTTLEAIDQIKKNGEEEFHTSYPYIYFQLCMLSPH